MKKDLTVLLNEQKADLEIVRNKMKEIMNYLTDENVDIAKRKSNIAMFNTVNNSAKIVVSSIITELTINKLTAIDADVIEK